MVGLVEGAVSKRKGVAFRRPLSFYFHRGCFHKKQFLT
uniref:Uncharacterized protein n=1 Tax=Siphoviridae sp. ctEBu1 TaxID=2825393 RepID=A0A8S5QFR5_9CAUD|nr:MAG TPA: hypothetical protein [Siphoviridae sp. ctEBu1]